MFTLFYSNHWHVEPYLNDYFKTKKFDIQRLLGWLLKNENKYNHIFRILFILF